MVTYFKIAKSELEFMYIEKNTNCGHMKFVKSIKNGCKECLMNNDCYYSKIYDSCSQCVKNEYKKT